LRERLWQEQGLCLYLEGLGKENTNIDGKAEDCDIGSPADFDPHNAQQLAFKGKVTGFREGYISENPSENHINVIYVKSNINPSLMSEDCDFNTEVYPCSVQQYYIGHKRDPDDINRFPNHGTGETARNLTRATYYAYRDLGHYLGKLIDYKDGELSIACWATEPFNNDSSIFDCLKDEI
jgi:hypothetical protein